jgi:hypothetical protein
MRAMPHEHMSTSWTELVTALAVMAIIRSQARARPKPI